MIRDLWCVLAYTWECYALSCDLRYFLLTVLPFMHVSLAYATRAGRAGVCIGFGSMCLLFCELFACTCCWPRGNVLVLVVLDQCSRFYKFVAVVIFTMFHGSE